MERALGSIVLILLGAGVLAVAWRSFLAGEMSHGVPESPPLNDRCSI